jgi:L-alanine-DL-glutamate epimerase-like enolase superfamily enzyme
VVFVRVGLAAGSIRLEDRPGLGATPDPDALKRYRVHPAHKGDSR